MPRILTEENTTETCTLMAAAACYYSTVGHPVKPAAEHQWKGVKPAQHPVQKRSTSVALQFRTYSSNMDAASRESDAGSDSEEV